MVVTYKYLGAVPNGVLRADDAARCEIDEALRIAERSGDDRALGLTRLTHGIALVRRDSRADRVHGLEVLGQVREMCLQDRYSPSDLPVAEVWAARE